MWLQQYIECLEKDYFTTKQHLYDIMAGTLGLHLTVRRSYYDQQVSRVGQMIDIADDHIKSKIFYGSCRRSIVKCWL